MSRLRRVLMGAGVALCATAIAPVVVPADAAPRAVSRPAVPARQPNVVVILVDDLGWPDVSAYGRHDVPTPNIDRIAQTGVAFSSGYVTASVCAVSRAGLLTGRNPQQFGFTYNINDEGDRGAGIPESQPTIAQRLKPLGYRTGAFGKWHVGSEARFYPTNRGFDEFFGFVAGETVYVDPRTPGIVTTPTRADKGKPAFDTRRGGGVIVEGPDRRAVHNFDKYLTNEITDHAVGFINRAARGGQPFMAYVAYNAPHWPLQVPQAWYDRFAHIQDPVRRTYVAMIAAMDDGVGQILNTLEANHVRRDTIVVFLSDNGCPVQFGFCNPDHVWSAGKFTYLEGGVRVPFLMSWPGGMKPQGIVDTPVSSVDIAATVLRAAAPGRPLPRELDGVDLVRSATRAPAAPRLLTWAQAPVAAARLGRYKLWHSDDWRETHLYDLTADPAEMTDVSAQQPATRALLDQRLNAWRKSLPAPLWDPHFTRRVQIGPRETELVY
ncbi:sulfatase-like hydrolase/transferase [Novosphingobium sp. FSY-8]|uniref:Sulfatase-like hydrolase/transferase n=1 Tax=Novosphingobium ovatum TaxID=1908523 RepID=A0ABW9X956_9SPHN|nr:sulfatase-like hydrolase/transferase [Novosphingobium ovatum]NBC35066.1 sulfatase-like hydrolase/transferase [Novosphingobium ovatum]